MLANYSNRQLIRFVTVLAVSVNVLLAILKLAIGLVIGSTALLADGIDSFLDIITSIFAYIGVQVANRPPLLILMVTKKWRFSSLLEFLL